MKSKYLILSLLVISSCSIFDDEDEKKANVFKNKLEGTWYIMDLFNDNSDKYQANPENDMYITETENHNIYFKTEVGAMQALFGGKSTINIDFYDTYDDKKGAFSDSGGYRGILNKDGQLWATENLYKQAWITNIYTDDPPEYDDDGDLIKHTNLSIGIDFSITYAFAQKVD